MWTQHTRQNQTSKPSTTQCTGLFWANVARHGDKNLAFGFRGSTFCSLPGCQDESRTASCHVRETVASNVARHSVLNRKDFYRKQWATVGYSGLQTHMSIWKAINRDITRSLPRHYLSLLVFSFFSYVHLWSLLGSRRRQWGEHLPHEHFPNCCCRSQADHAESKRPPQHKNPFSGPPLSCSRPRTCAPPRARKKV